MKRINWIYKFATNYVGKFKPLKVWHPAIYLFMMYVFLLFLTKGMTDFNVFVLGITLGLITYRYIRKKLNQLMIVWSIFYTAKYYKLED